MTERVYEKNKCTCWLQIEYCYCEYKEIKIEENEI